MSVMRDPICISMRFVVMQKYYIPAFIALFILATPAYAVSLSEIIRNCKADGKVYCEKSSYGKAMQVCLTQHREVITPACRGVVDRLNAGEKFSLF